MYNKFKKYSLRHPRSAKVVSYYDTYVANNNYNSCYRDSHQIDLPPFGHYATGIFFLDKLHHQDIEGKFKVLAESLGLRIICWRTVPTNNSTIGEDIFILECNGTASLCLLLHLQSRLIEYKEAYTSLLLI